MQTILIPSNFNISALDCIPDLCEQFQNEKLNVIFIHMFKLSDSISELLLLSRRSREFEMVGDDFYKGCSQLKAQYPQIEGIRVEFLYGSTLSMFRNFLDANEVNAVFEPESRFMEKIHKYSIDPTVLVLKSGLPVVRLRKKIIQLKKEPVLSAKREAALAEIWKEIVFVTIYAVLIAVLYKNLHFTRISIPIAVPTILGTVISLLLAFKSNQAYDRWWEARTIWGGIVNDSRTLTRQLLTFVDTTYESDEGKIFCERMAKRQIAWCYSLSRHLRKQDPLQGLKRLISAEDLETMGGCERIKNTIFPATYSVYIHFSVILFILLLPFGLIEFFGVVEVPTISQTIERDLKQMLKEGFKQEEKSYAASSYEKSKMFYIL
eukprot:gene16780-20149_t